jgi:hypothetical protein
MMLAEMITRLPYERLRVRLRRDLKAFESDELWGKKLVRAGWPYFERDEFRDARFLGLAWGGIKRDNLLRIEGKVRNRWELLSKWRSVGRSGGRAVAKKPPTVEEIREGFSSVSGRQPGRGELAYHLLKHGGMSREEAVKLMRGLGWDVRLVDLAGLRRNGRERVRQGLECRFCVKRAPK